MGGCEGVRGKAKKPPSLSFLSRIWRKTQKGEASTSFVCTWVLAISVRDGEKRGGTPFHVDPSKAIDRRRGNLISLNALALSQTSFFISFKKSFQIFLFFNYFHSIMSRVNRKCH
jgi:hypothetical protein